MQRPVEKYVESASVDIVRYDLLKELPKGIGDRFPTSIHFTERDVFPIADAILRKMKLCKSPEEHVIFDIHLKGIVPYWLSGQLTGIFYGCDDVIGFLLLHPNGTSHRMFPIEE